jgi:hypothetical protein
MEEEITLLPLKELKKFRNSGVWRAHSRSKTGTRNGSACTSRRNNL